MMGESGVRNTAIVLSLAVHGALFWKYGDHFWQPAEQQIASRPIVAQLSIAEPKPAVPEPSEVTPPKPRAEPLRPKVVHQPKPKPEMLRPSPSVKPKPVREEAHEPIQPEVEVMETARPDPAETSLGEQSPVAVARSEPMPASSSEDDEEKAAEKLRRYLAALQAAIAQHKDYPAMARRRGIEGQVEVTFMLLANGDASNIQVSGGPKPLRSAARKAVNKALRFPPPPAGTPTPLPVQYAMNFSLR